MISPEIPIVTGRFLIPMVSHAAFFAAIALSLSDRAIVIPVYMLVTFGLSWGLSWFEGSRLGPFLKHWYPAESEKLRTRTGYGYNSLRGLRFAFSGDPEDDRILKRIRRHQRGVWFEAFSMPLVVAMVIVSAVSVSKYHG